MTTVHERGRGRLMLLAAVLAMSVLAAACGQLEGGDQHGAGRAAADRGHAGRRRQPGDRGGGRDRRLEPARAASGPSTAASSARRCSSRWPTVGPDNGAKPWLATSWIANDTFDRWPITLRAGRHVPERRDVRRRGGQAEHRGRRQRPAVGPGAEGLFEEVSVVDDHTVRGATSPSRGPRSRAASSTGRSAFMMAPAMLEPPDHGDQAPDRHRPVHVRQLVAGRHRSRSRRTRTTGRRACPTSTRSSSRSSPTTRARSRRPAGRRHQHDAHHQRRGRQRPGGRLHGDQGLGHRAGHDHDQHAPR